MAAASFRELKEVMEYAYATDGCVYFRVPGAMPDDIDCVVPGGPIDQPRVVREGSRGLVVRLPDRARRSPPCRHAWALELTGAEISAK